MAWLILFVAGLCEIGWAVGLKYTDGFSRLWPTVFTGASLIVSMALLGVAMKSLPLGTAYAVWTGIGAVGTVILGIVLFKEPATGARCTIAVDNGSEVLPRADVSLTSDMQFSWVEDIETTQEATVLVNASVTYTFPNQH